MAHKQLQQSTLSKAALLITRSMRIKERDRAIPFLEQKRHGAKPKTRYRITHGLSHYSHNGYTVWRLASRRARESTSLTVLYLHGGSYELGFHSRHWTFIARMADILDCEMIVPDYPLAPEHHAKEVIEMVFDVYCSITSGNKSVNTVIMGDSAGGGLALSLAQILQTRAKQLPKHLVLFSPWLDVTMSNPDINELDRRDPLLNVTSLSEAGKAYAGELDPKDPRVSPLFGNLSGLPPLTVFVGTAELFLADCRLLQQKAESAGTTVHLIEVSGMIHPGVFLPIPEARWILKTVRQAVLDSH
ncbi:MAG: alpha/beta hydrolase [Spirochaetota bacterium]